MRLKTEYKYIMFVQTTLVDNWNCLNKKQKDELGSVFFYKPWKQYVFEFNELGDCVFNSSCLRDIAHFLDQLNKQRNINQALKDSKKEGE